MTAKRLLPYPAIRHSKHRAGRPDARRGLFNLPEWVAVFLPPAEMTSHLYRINQPSAMGTAFAPLGLVLLARRSEACRIHPAAKPDPAKTNTASKPRHQATPDYRPERRSPRAAATCWVSPQAARLHKSYYQPVTAVDTH